MAIQSIMANIITVPVPIFCGGGGASSFEPMPWYFAILFSPILFGLGIVCFGMCKEMFTEADGFMAKLVLSLILIPVGVLAFVLGVVIWVR